MQIGVAFCVTGTGGTVAANVLSGLSEIGVRVGAISAVGASCISAVAYAALNGTDAKKLIQEAESRNGFFIRLGEKNRPLKRYNRLISQIEAVGVKNLSDIEIPLYLLCPYPDNRLKIFTSRKKSIILGNDITGSSELQIRSCLEEAMQTKNCRFPKGFLPYYPLNCIGNDSIFSVVSTHQRTRGYKTSYGYCLELKTGNDIVSLAEDSLAFIREDYKNILTALYLK